MEEQLRYCQSFKGILLERRFIWGLDELQKDLNESNIKENTGSIRESTVLAIHPDLRELIVNGTEKARLHQTNRFVPM